MSRHELALTLCEHWGWVGASGKLQRQACEKLLDRLAQEGLVELPAKREARPRSLSPAAGSGVGDEETAPRPSVACALSAVRPVRLERVEGREAVALWSAFVERYHALGSKTSFGGSLRYYIGSPRGRLGCMLVASGARALRCRDEWVGWSAQQRLCNLPYVINNSRFLLFPWVRVLHLASHVLGQLARQVRDDWAARWGYQPVLLETFVDPAQHSGACYRAAGWEVLGETTGQGLRLRGHTYRTRPKLVLVRPLVRDFRARLLSDPEPRRS
ncbi:MAG: Druantia anti-phage system protein DruA [Pseudomonadota bacterium]